MVLSSRSRRWLAAAVVALIALVGLARCASDDGGPPTAGSTSSTGSVRAGTVTVGSAEVVPRAANDSTAGDLRPYVGRKAVASKVLVLSVPADEGFWVGTSPFDRVWVQMTGAGESSFLVRAGERASFTGLVVAHDAQFPARAGVTMLEGASRLASEGAHLQVARSSVVLSQ